MERFKGISIFFVVAGLFILDTASIAISAPMTLKLAHVVSTSAPYHIGAMQLAKLVEQKTKGQLKIEIYPGGQLGKGER